MFLTVYSILTTIVCVILGYVTYNSLRKIETYEDWFVSTKAQITRAIGTMQALDLRGTFAGKPLENGAFESDDEVGDVFKDLKGVVLSLNSLINSDDLNDNQPR